MWNEASQAREPIHDYTPALQYGDLVPVLTHSVGIGAQAVLHEIRKKLKDFSDNDYLLLAGDPAAILLCGMVAGEHNLGRVKMLRYDRKQKRYIELSADLRSVGVGATV